MSSGVASPKIWGGDFGAGFNAVADIFAVRNLGLSAVFCSGHPTWSADNLCSLQ